MSFAADVRLDAARAALLRYKQGSYAMACECFASYDPKGKGTQRQRLNKPWLHTPYHQEIWETTEYGLKGHIDEIRLHKSKQAWGSWGIVGISAAHMLLQEGFLVYAQSRTKEISYDLAERVAYIYRNLRGPFAGDVFVEGRDWSLSGSSASQDGARLEVHQFLGEERRSAFTAMPKGSKAWRFAAGSLGILDEFAYHDHQEQTHNAAESATEGGGLLYVLSTGVWSTFFNQVVDEGIEASEVA